MSETQPQSKTEKRDPLGGRRQLLDPVIYPDGHTPAQQAKARENRARHEQDTANRQANRPNRIKRAVAVGLSAATLSGVGYVGSEFVRKDENYLRIDNSNRNRPVGATDTGEQPQGVPPAQSNESVDDN